MQDRKGFTVLVTEERQYTLPLILPPKPGIKTTRRAEHCRFCHGIHMNVQDFLACREANT